MGGGKTKKFGVQSLVISPDLDALLEHDERTRRAWADHDSPGPVSPPPPIGQGLPPPPRRPRVGSPMPLSPLPRSPLIAQQQTPERVSVDSNPYINPAPLFIDEDPGPTPISPPPRSSSMGVGFSMGVSRPVMQPRQSDDTSPSQASSQSSSSPVDSRFPTPPSRAFLPLRKKPSSPKEPASPKELTPKRSRGKLVKQRDSSGSSVREWSRSQSQSSSPQQSSSPHQPSSSPQMSEVPMARPREIKRQLPRPRSSISVSSAMTASDHESFIDLFSPSNQDFSTDLADGPFVAASPSLSNFPPSSSNKPSKGKPPIPTTPKPDFSQRVSASASLHPSHSLRPHSSHSPRPTGPPSVPTRAVPPGTMPATTNFLNPTERAQLVKKSRKLAQVFGQTPHAAEFSTTSPDNPNLSSASLAGSSFLDVASSSKRTKGKGHRAAASMNILGQMPAQRPLPPWPGPEKTIFMTANGRRHSTHGSPDAASSVISFAPERSDSGEGDDDARSFMDWNSNSNSQEYERRGQREANSNADEQELHPDDSISVLSVPPPSSSLPQSPSSPSDTASMMTPEAQADAERRRRRDKLAKLHRFLGSRVPPSLVLGPGVAIDAALPPPAVTLDGTLTMSPTSESPGKPWVRRRRSISEIGVGKSGGETGWEDARDRVKEELGDKEKAIIVRRAQKMEKVFGVAPPQRLYSSSSTGLPSNNTSPANTLSSSSGTTSNVNPESLPQKNPNQAPYKRKSARHRDRPGTADSAQYLLAGAEPSAGQGAGVGYWGVGVGQASGEASTSGGLRGGSGSFVYTHYQHSLNSLHDILDRDDKASLAELHQYLNEDATKAARRRSLPARTSMASLASVASTLSISSTASINSTSGLSTITTDTTATAHPDATGAGGKEFQARRRRAAKLTQFFGVDYRDLIDDVLESIEHGLDAERKRGSLNPAEAEVSFFFITSYSSLVAFFRCIAFLLGMHVCGGPFCVVEFCVFFCPYRRVCLTLFYPFFYFAFGPFPSWFHSSFLYLSHFRVCCVSVRFYLVLVYLLVSFPVSDPLLTHQTQDLLQKLRTLKRRA
ncbi:hypothetical protein DFH07DRAFT_754809 [Mycena maculata]|uniref:Uncharacterized protein n=1 Tax=Mycena maculata TaxID=230809 RepID=A0AAD7I4C0_9AGAR|nr:hypothetical protein DFH07DRAFT_754809 [Mycena maculata]